MADAIHATRSIPGPALMMLRAGASVEASAKPA